MNARAASRGRRFYPASAAQLRFWALDQNEPGNPALNVAVRWRLEGPWSQSALRHAWQVLTARHEPLRCFMAEAAEGPDGGGGLQQVVEPAIPPRYTEIDLTQATDPAEQAERLAAEEARRPFNLSLAPLLRITRLVLAPDLSVLLITAHHIICDGWSVGLLADQMLTLCADHNQATPPAGPDELEPIQYGEFAAWQAQAGNDTQRDTAIAYWRDALAGLQPFELPTDHPRRTRPGTNGRIESLVLARPLTQALAATATAAGCSLFAASLASLMVLLHRQTEETDIALGTQLAGRDAVELESVIGVFINTVVLRADLSGDPSFRTVLAQVAARTRAALQHADAPFEAVLQATRTPRDPSRHPLFSANFIFQRSFVHNAARGGLRLTDLPSVSAGAMYDLNFFMVERPDGWRFSCEYDTDLFDQPTIAGLIARLPVLLAGAIAAPDTRISALPIMDAAERHRLLHGLNATAAPLPPHTHVHDLVTAAAATQPDALAVVCGQTSLTYRALLAAAAQVTAALRAHNIPPGARVGVLLDREATLPAALLGVMAAGAAYVPLDPAYPLARLQQIAADAGLAALVTRATVLDRRTLAAPAHILMEVLPPPEPEPPPSPTPGTVAYVIYTSGSTGRPKGVVISHRALSNLLWAMRDRPGCTAQDVLLAVTTISFDIAALELFLPLICGGRAVLTTDGEAADGHALRSLLDRHGATIMQATPVTWRLLLEAGWRPSPSLRMLCGGEALPRPLADALTTNGATLWNMYGPTETTIWSAALPVAPASGPVPIGGPIANTQLHVLDRTGNLAPIGAPGELAIGGEGVADAYLGQPALTAERFIPDPFTPALTPPLTPPGNTPFTTPPRLYRTGDRVRRRADGTLDFLGRADHQIKLRGLRVELGAIEAVLVHAPQVTEAVVIAGRPAGPASELELWAYIQPPTPLSPTQITQATQAARRHVAEHLPAYMVPARITVLAALPRTPNGKIDRAALPPPATTILPPVPAPTLRPDATDQTADPIRTRLAAIWTRVLGVPAANPDDDFFELGGNSLTATRMLGEVNAAFERRLRPASLFRHPTLGQLADLLRRPAEWDFDFSEVVQLQPEGTRPALIALNNTGVFLRLARRLGRAQPFIALQLFDPALRREAVAEDFRAIAAEYVQLILQAQPEGPYALIGWCVAGSLGFEVAQQLRRLGRVVCLVVIIDAWAPGYDDTRGPLANSLTDMSLRIQTIARDAWWVARKRLPLAEFVYRRRLLRRWLQSTAPNRPAQTEDERYHGWILSRLNAAARRYEAPDYDGHVLLLRADREPRGPFIDRRLGWARHVTGTLTTAYVRGDHTSIFADPGVQQMADHITRAMDQAIA